MKCRVTIGLTDKPHSEAGWHSDIEVSEQALQEVGFTLDKRYVDERQTRAQVLLAALLTDVKAGGDIAGIRSTFLAAERLITGALADAADSQAEK